MSTCKICFEIIPEHGLRSSLNKKSCICQKCFNNWNPVWHSWKIDGVEVLSVYPYDETVKSMLFQFKGCYDRELGSVFFERQKHILHFLYRNYVLVPLPSSKEDDEIRGFNHVQEMFSYLRLPFVPALYKRVRYKQSDLSKEERTKVRSKIGIKNKTQLSGKRVLIVDDVITTGSSVRAAISLIKEAKPLAIKVLTCSYNQLHKNSKNTEVLTKKQNV